VIHWSMLETGTNGTATLAVVRSVGVEVEPGSAITSARTGVGSVMRRLTVGNGRITIVSSKSRTATSSVDSCRDVLVYARTWRQRKKARSALGKARLASAITRSKVRSGSQT